MGQGEGVSRTQYPRAWMHPRDNFLDAAAVRCSFALRRGCPRQRRPPSLAAAWHHGAGRMHGGKRAHGHWQVFRRTEERVCVCLRPFWPPFRSSITNAESRGRGAAPPRRTSPLQPGQAEKRNETAPGKAPANDSRVDPAAQPGDSLGRSASGGAHHFPL